MTGIRNLLVMPLVLMLCSCSAESVDRATSSIVHDGAMGDSAITDTDGLMSWVIGDWVSSDGAITEHWHAVSPDTLEGKGVTTSRDRVSIEIMRLVRMGEDVFFIAKVPHNELAIAFRMTDESTADRVVFSNPTHDFPRQIVYRKDGSDDMIVTVSDGGTEGFELHFTRR